MTADSGYPVGVSVEEGRELLLRRCAVQETECVPLTAAYGRVLGSDVTAGEDIPPFPRSPYDGYALRAEDTRAATPQSGVVLTVTEEVAAGHSAKKSVAPGETVKILTGAPIPPGADAVIKFEDVEFTKENIQLFKKLQSGENVVPAGEDFRQGAKVLERGTRLDGASLGILASLGVSDVKVHKQPRVCLLSTGDELLPPDAPLTYGKIRNSSVYALNGYIQNTGARVKFCGIVPDRLEVIAEAIAAASTDSDFVITTGGVSVGDYDLVCRALERLGAELLFWKVSMKPGSACAAAVYQNTPVLCLSGNPGAAAAAFFLLGAPALRKMAGRRDIEPRTAMVRLLRAFEKKSPTRRFLPGRVEVRDAIAYFSTAPRQGNGMLSPLCGCTVLAEIAAGSPPLQEGSIVKIHAIN